MWRCLWAAVLHAALILAEVGDADGAGVHRERLDDPAAVSAAGKIRFLPCAQAASVSCRFVHSFFVQPGR